MARPVVVRPVEDADAPLLEPLWQDVIESVSAGPLPGGAGTVERARLRWESSTDASRCLIVAWDGEEPVGIAALSDVEVGPWSRRGILVSLLHVRSGARRRGAGRALMREALAIAEREGADQIVVDVPPHLREANRFFARLGFGAVITRRVASTAAVHQHLHGTDPARRRLARLRARSGRRGGATLPAPAQPPPPPEPV